MVRFICLWWGKFGVKSSKPSPDILIVSRTVFNLCLVNSFLHENVLRVFVLSNLHLHQKPMASYTLFTRRKSCQVSDTCHATTKERLFNTFINRRLVYRVSVYS